MEQINNFQKQKIELARKLINISPERAEIEHLVERIPEIMCANDQLRPLWKHWEKEGKTVKSPYKIFARQEILILKAFLEYISYASDHFISQIHGEK